MRALFSVQPCIATSVPLTVALEEVPDHPPRRQRGDLTLPCPVCDPMAAQKNILRGISKATPAVVQVVDSTPEESLATARFFAGNAAEADSAEHVVMWLETALIWARGAVE